MKQNKQLFIEKIPVMFVLYYTYLLIVFDWRSPDSLKDTLDLTQYILSQPKIWKLSNIIDV